MKVDFEVVFKKITNHPEGILFKGLRNAFRLYTRQELKELSIILKKLTSSGKIFINYKNYYVVFDPKKHFISLIRINAKRHGFVYLPENEEEFYFVFYKKSHGAINGDTVIFKLNPSRHAVKTRPEAEILSVIKRGNSKITGVVRMSQERRKFYFEPNNLLLANYRFSLVDIKEAICNNVYSAKIIGYNYRFDVLKVRLIKNIGHENTIGVDLKTIINENNIEIDFQTDTLKEIRSIDRHVSSETITDYNERVNLVDLPLFTIDGAHSKDFDDAICVQKEKNGNFRLIVAIADVSYYVQFNTRLDNEALSRGCSGYFLNMVVPMLPKLLSNNLCSLKPNQIRLCMVCDINLNSKGEVINHQIYKGMMKSHARLRYEEVNTYLERNTKLPDNVSQGIDNAVELNNLLKINTKKRGYINFNFMHKMKLVVNESNEVLEIKSEVQQDAENLIENFMVIANNIVAETILSRKDLFIYRNHHTPLTERLEELNLKLKNFGIRFKLPTKNITSFEMQSTIDKLHNEYESDFDIIIMFFLRSLGKAKYEIDNIGHFGLALKAYTHFTSPIRRYSDLIVHRLLKKYLALNKDQTLSTDANYTHQTLKNIAEQVNDAEERTVNCERAIKQMKIAQYMSNKIGETYKGVISFVTKFGFFVQLIPSQIEGLIHIKNLEDDYYVYDEENGFLIGEKNRVTFKIGMHVEITVFSASKKLRQINFSLVRILA